MYVVYACTISQSGSGFCSRAAADITANIINDEMQWNSEKNELRAALCKYFVSSKERRQLLIGKYVKICLINELIYTEIKSQSRSGWPMTCCSSFFMSLDNFPFTLANPAMLFLCFTECIPYLFSAAIIELISLNVESDPILVAWWEIVVQLDHKRSQQLFRYLLFSLVT